MGRHATPLVTSYFPPNLRVLSGVYYLAPSRVLPDVFHFALFPAVFKASKGAGSSTSKVSAGLHANLRNIDPAQLFV